MKNLLLLLAVMAISLFFNPANAQVVVTATDRVLGPSTYTTLKLAFDAINSGTHQGAITIKITGNVTETATALLTGTGVKSSSSNYTSIHIYPTSSGLSITSAQVTFINLSGAKNVTIDGRVNGEGTEKDLSIINTNTGSSTRPPTSTIKFYNGASNNAVKYCTLKGSGIGSNAGVIVMGDTDDLVGNNNDNTIDNNNITSSSDGARPVNAVYCSGLAAPNVSHGNSITNNNIYDFLNRGISSNGIFIASSAGSGYAITGNSFYETATFIPTASVAYVAINFQPYSGGTDHVISNNYIGGSSPSCGTGGSVTSWTKTNDFNNSFIGISLYTANTGGTKTNVQGNTIKNFTYSNSLNAIWYGIFVLAGDMNIGTTNGNTIGEPTGNGSILFTNSTSGGIFYGIYNQDSGGTIDARNNTIGSITVANTNSTFATNFCGIYQTGGVGSTILNNTIGSVSAGTTNSINVTSLSTASAQSVYGIQNQCTGLVTISGNTISKLTNGTTNASTSALGVIDGIMSTAGYNVISKNTVSDLTIANANTASTYQASVCGIGCTSGMASLTIYGNTISNLSNSYDSFAGSVTGLYYAGGIGGVNSVYQNLIHSLSVTGPNSIAASIYGLKIDAGASTSSNNIITLGGDTKTSLYGIFETGLATQNNNIYFNTVYIGGSLVSGATNKSFAMYSSVTTNTRNIRNNIFDNTRSTVGGQYKHFAMYVMAGTLVTLNCNYNDYQASGVGGYLGSYGGGYTNALPIVTSQDANSLIIDPSFAVGGGYIACKLQLIGNITRRIRNRHFERFQ